MARRFHVFRSSALSVLNWNESCEGLPLPDEEHAVLGERADGLNARELAECKRKAEAVGGRTGQVLLRNLSLIDPSMLIGAAAEPDQSMPAAGP